ncbi:hypothetical protein DFH05DRAFT_1081554 [Lentinula detonsa]|uniref:Uncharacterized protein n=1 Tax=Lentinula detonsa TaxID=2804962 RepID=A0A9W8TY75_9AGAR|nr:hypothetical protein DFH05DRAFT_1081554 [Lentinula detonsa]
MKNMHDCHETDESQTSQELAKLLASGRPDISENSQASDELSANHEAPDLAQPEHGSRRRFSLLGLGQGLPMSQTQNLSDDLEVEEEGSHSSQKENLHSSTDSSKLGPNPLCSSNENALSRSKKSTNKTLGVSSQSCLPNPIIPALQLTSSNSDPTSQTPESLQGFSAFVDCPGGSSDEPAGDISSRPSHRPNGASDSEMICSHFGASSPERLDSIRRALSKNPTPISNYVGSDSQGSDKASQVSGLGSQDDEPQAQVVPQFDMSELRELENEFYGDTQPQSQATQSTQPTATPDNDVKDDAWANFTGIQVPPHRRHRYLASAKEGAALQAVRNDTFYDGFDSSSSAPDNDEIFRQFPAGTPDPTCNSQQETQETQLVETQLVGNLQQEDEWVPPVQFPAGYGPAPEDEGAATQIVETQVATQIVDDSSPDEDTPVDTSPPVVPDPPPRASVIRVKSPMHSLETVPDSEPPSVVPDPPPRTSFIRVKSPIHSLETAPDSEPPSAISDPPPRTSFIRTKSPINSLEIVPDSEPPVPSPAHSLERSSVHVGTSQRRAIGTRTIIQPAEAQTQPTDIDEDDEDDKPLAAIVKSDRRKDADDPSAARKPPPPKVSIFH